MSEAYSCSVCGLMDRDLDRFDAKMRCEQCTAPVRKVVADKPEPHIPYTGPLPAYDPLVQEARDYWTPRIGREAANELNPDCDPLDGERR